MGLTHRHPLQATAVPGPAAGAGELPGYAELHCLSNFSFQRGHRTRKSWSRVLPNSATGRWR